MMLSDHPEIVRVRVLSQHGYVVNDAVKIVAKLYLKVVFVF